MTTTAAQTDLSLWMLARLVSHDDCRTPLARLHNEFAMWSLGNNVAYIRRVEFESLLRTSGAVIEGVMVRDFCLREDLP
jgi:hypothetical protein